MRTPTTRVAAVLIAAALLLAACGSESEESTATTEQTTTTTEASTTTLAPSTEQPETAVWPFASESERFSEPVDAASSFAVDYLGFVDPVVGEFQAGDSRSGEVAIQPEADGPVTTIFVRMLAPDDSWWVLGAATDSLQLESPAALAVISSPVTLSGQSTAFEATVNVEVRQDGTVDPLAEDIVMGGSMGEMGPFSKAVPFDAPQATAGAIVLKTLSAKDGAIWEAAVTRVSFES